MRALRLEEWELFGRFDKRGHYRPITAAEGRVLNAAADVRLWLEVRETGLFRLTHAGRRYRAQIKRHMAEQEAIEAEWLD